MLPPSCLKRIDVQVHDDEKILHVVDLMTCSILYVFLKMYPVSPQLLAQWKDNFYTDMPLEKFLPTRTFRMDINSCQLLIS